VVTVMERMERVTKEQVDMQEKVDLRDLRTSKIFDIQRFSVQDGPGIRTLIFLKGCPLRCPWCCNPESQNAFCEVGHIDSLCNQCGDCLKVCEPNGITFAQKGINIDHEKCTNCGKCISACTQNALRAFGKERSLEEVFDEVRKDTIYYNKSGGGITVSGGEVLVQAKLAATILKCAQEMNIHTAIETSGYGTEAALNTILEYVDLVLFDLKIMDPAAHVKHLGVPNEPIHRNARAIVEKGVPMIIRIPLVPTLTDTEENIQAIVRFVKELDPKLAVHLLPYHKYGVSKYSMLDREYEVDEMETQSNEHLAEIVKYFETCGLACEIVR
jgi:pyruvate formate lyase activating enzyme